MDESKHVACLVCGSTLLKSLQGYASHYLVRCGTCGFVFSERKPSIAELMNVYQQYSRNNYLSPLTTRRYHELLDKVEKFRKTNHMLDVGCGNGYFLEVAKERGWKVFGTEFTEEAVHICREKGISMQQGQLDPDQYDPPSFDVITSFEVLEHINNPQEEIENFHTLLRPGGLVYLTTPNFNSLSRFILKEKWNVLAYPEHLSYYSGNTIDRLFNNHGFSLLKMETTGVSITRAKTSLKLSNQSFISESSDDEKIRRVLESNTFLRFSKNVANRLLSSISAGDTIKAMFVKK